MRIEEIQVGDFLVKRNRMQAIDVPANVYRVIGILRNADKTEFAVRVINQAADDEILTTGEIQKMSFGSSLDADEWKYSVGRMLKHIEEQFKATKELYFKPIDNNRLLKG